MKRRSFLVSCGVCGGAALVGIRGFVYDDARWAGLRNFSPRQGVILAALFDTVLPPVADRAAIPGHVRAFDAFVTGLPAGDVEQLGQCLYALEHGTLPLGGHAQRFSALPPEDREDCLLAWQTSSVGLLRLGFRSLKALVFLTYYRLPETWKPIGYEGPALPGGSPELGEKYARLRAPAKARPRGGG